VIQRVAEMLVQGEVGVEEEQWRDLGWAGRRRENGREEIPSATCDRDEEGY